MLKRFSPYRTAPIDHPLFMFELRRVRWGRTPKALRRHTWIVISLTVAVCVIAWTAYKLISNHGSLVYNQYPDGLTLNRMFLASIGLSFILDVVSLGAALAVVRGDAYHWDLARLATVNERTFIRAKLACARLQVWWLTIGIIGVRVAVILIFLIWDTFMPPSRPASGSVARYLIESFPRQPFMIFLIVLGFIVSVAIYWLDPVRRTPALAAAGLWIAVTGQTAAIRWLLALAVVFVVWLSQAFIYLIATTVGSWIYRFFADDVPLSNNVAFLLSIIGVIIVVGLGTIGYFYLLRRLSFRLAARAFSRSWI